MYYQGAMNITINDLQAKIHEIFKEYARQLIFDFDSLLETAHVYTYIYFELCFFRSSSVKTVVNGRGNR